MPVIAEPGLRPVRMGDTRVSVSRRDDGTIYLRSGETPDDYPRAITDKLDYWAEHTPDQVFLADRDSSGAWQTRTYRQTRQEVRQLAQYLLNHDLSVDRPVLILSGNSLAHGLLALAAMYVGIPYAPVSPAYSLISKDFAKLRHVCELLEPGLVFVEDGAKYAKALSAVVPAHTPVLVVENGVAEFAVDTFSNALATDVTDAVDQANARVGEDTIAKFLFTSGSTGMPKAVINTQRMICFNQMMLRHTLAFLQDEPPVMLDWLPWNHTAGGNHNFGIALYNGGSFYIDQGKPTPDGIFETVRNLCEISPTMYFNVPKGFEMLVQHLQENPVLRDSFFRRLKLMQYAGAGLSQYVWDNLERIALDTIGEKIVMVTGYGSTETAPFAFTTTWAVDQAASVGLPAVGLDVKLVPNGEKLEVRLRGPSITPGYWKQPDKTRESFDDEGYYLIGDALKFVDPDNIERGFLFDGRVCEDFKLSTGTWVHVAAIRANIADTFAPYVRDAVLTGLNENHIGALLFADFVACRKLCPDLPDGASERDIATHPLVLAHFQQKLNELASKATGSAQLVARAILLDRSPDLDAHEVTDKGSINQRAVLTSRADKVADLYREPVPEHVMIAQKGN
ncbi:feruloyl-CoA synthase [Thalassospira profundimaris]|uniref:Feruloyl-CoA synthase n=1 Tax=Thalassospira profundimaris TaxID=502049 RepID=A0A367X0I3_9PROT|nr:feruloyl-CoA synthase [Thalassospira profundimaris]RCK46520.1 feruloyl-CoA synthase [Thalassospira profundimaris]